MNAHMHACTQREAALWHRLATMRGFSSLRRGPLARPGLERGHILQGVSKQRWHVDVLARAPLSAPYHRISRPCQKSSCGCFLSPLFSSLFLLFPPEKRLTARENRIIVCFNGCSIPQVYPDLKIPIKKRTGLTTGMMLMLIWVRSCFYCLKSSLCHLPLNSFSADWHLWKCIPVTYSLRNMTA